MAVLRGVAVASTAHLRHAIWGAASGKHRRRAIDCFCLALGGRSVHDSAARGRVLCSGVTDQPDTARGGLPRFHLDKLPELEGMLASVEGDEYLHMVRVLRLKELDRVELFDGRGGVVCGQLRRVTRTVAEVATVENMRTLSPLPPHWHVAAAFCALKGGRGEWLVEKCTELGARTLTPLLTQRSSSVSRGRTDRWRRIAMAATKQCQRLHNLDIQEPAALESFLPKISQAEVAFVASAESPPFLDSLESCHRMPQSGILFVGPEGGYGSLSHGMLDLFHFTVDELNSLVGAGARPVGLGPRRLRVETATMAMLAAVMLTMR